MYFLKINNNLIRNIIIFYEDNIPQSESTKIDIKSNNKIEIIKDNKIIKEYILHPIIQ